jgi:RNA polymerase sigma-70 factor (ECF subfamily)
MAQCTNISGFAALPALERAAPEQVVESAPQPAPQLADDALVAAVREGDETAFELLFERHRRSVMRLAYRFFYRREQVEDIVQESFASAYFALGSYRGGQEKSFIAWLTRITVRTCYDALRRAKRTESSLSELSENDTALLSEKLRGNGSSEIENAAISRDLASKLLDRLEPEDRLVLTLLSVADLSVAEAAELTGWSVSKVKMRTHRARRALQKVLHRFV